MAQILTAIGGSVVVSMVGKEVLLQTISETAKAIYSIGVNAASYATTYPNVNSVYKNLDLLATIRVIDALMSDLNNKNETKSINVALDNLRESLQELHNEMNKIDIMMQEHSLKYFNAWRNLDFTMELVTIENIYNTLLKRLDLFTKIHNIAHGTKNKID